jgi:hypothetical protein
VPNGSLKQVVTELIATARRIKLEESIDAALADIAHFGIAQQAAAKATIVAERLIGRFVTELGASSQSRPEPTFDVRGITEEPIDIQQNFAVGWLRAFYTHAIANAQSVDGLVHDPEQNIRLGRILQQFDAAIPSLPHPSA